MGELKSRIHMQKLLKIQSFTQSCVASKHTILFKSLGLVIYAFQDYIYLFKIQ